MTLLSGDNIVIALAHWAEQYAQLMSQRTAAEWIDWVAQRAKERLER